MRVYLQIWFVLAAFLFIAPFSAYACSCIGAGLPCQALWTSGAVFSGEVKEINNNSTETEMSSGTKFTIRQNKVRFAVNESFRGVSGNAVEITTGVGGGDCGYQFETGKSYLVYAYKNPTTGQLSTGICSRTQSLEKAGEDLAYFRSLKSAESGSTIYGQVVRSYARKNDEAYRQPSPLGNIPVTIEGVKGNFETKTDESGKYRLTGLPAGEYNIRLKVPENLWGYEQGQKVKVYDKGCAGSYFALQTKTILSGQLLNERSEPASEISVDLIPVEQVNNSRHFDSKFDYTDQDGRFTFRSIPDGKYYLGIRLSGMSDILFPYPQTFYPGTLNLSEAKIINIQEGQILENLDFKLSKKLPTRKVSGIVVFPDGTPAANAIIGVNETEYFYSFSFSSPTQTKADGTFSFDIVDGIRYLVKPVVSLKDGQHHAEPIEISASGDVSNLKFVITEPNGNCEKCLHWTRNPK